MKCYKLSINTNGTTNNLSLPDSKRIKIDIIDAFIIDPSFYLSEVVNVSGRDIGFCAQRNREQIIQCLNSASHKSVTFVINQNQVRITSGIFGSTMLSFQPKSKIREILGFNNDSYVGNSIIADSKLDQRIFYYDVKLGSKTVAIITENKVVYHESFIIDNLQELQLKIFEDTGAPLVCNSGHLLIKVDFDVSMGSTEPSKMKLGDYNHGDTIININCDV